MMFGAFGNTDHDDSIRIIHAALDAGINFVDTADVYSFGESEEIVGKALAQTKRHKVVLATKVHGQMGRDPNAQGNSRRWIMTECENSLRRLGVDYIDLYQIHRPSPETDIDETLGALHRPRAHGQDPLLRQLDLPRPRDRRGAVGGRAPRPASASSPSSPRTPSSCAASRRTCCRCARSTAWACCRGARWPAAGSRAPSARARRTRAAGRPCCRTTTTWRSRATGPSSRRSTQLSAAGRRGGAHPSSSWRSGSCSSTPASPARSSGRAPWSTSSRSCPPSSCASSPDVLDRIDEIVPPGTDLNETDVGWVPAAIADRVCGAGRR